MIDSAELCAGLYLLRATSPPPSSECNKHVVQSNHESGFVTESLDHSNRDSLVMMLHYRLGHPNFPYLAHLFPALFLN